VPSDNKKGDPSMMKWFGFSLGIFNTLLLVFTLFYDPQTQGLLFPTAVSPFLSNAFLLSVISSWMILLALISASESGVMQGFSWISGISIFLSIVIHLILRIVWAANPVSWVLVFESVLLGLIIFGVPLGVSILLIIYPFRTRKV
jgi:hypothetical protein